MQKSNKIFRTVWAVLCLAAMVVVLMLSFVGCGDQPVDPSSDVLDASDSSGQTEYPKPEGTAIRWAVPQYTSQTGYSVVPSEEAIHLFNQELQNRGYDFYLELVPIKVADDYYGILRNSSFDIVNTGLNFVFENGVYEFSRLVNEGYFAPLDEYLALPEFQTLKEMYGDAMWQWSTVNDSIYVLPFDNGVQARLHIVFNREYFTEEDLDGFDGSLVDLAARIELPAVQERIQQHNILDIEPIIISHSPLYDNLIARQGLSLFGVYLSPDGSGAKNPLEVDSILDNLRAINQLNQNEKIKISTAHQINSSNVLSNDSFITCITNGVDSSFDPEKFIAFPLEYYHSLDIQRVNGVVATSEHKKEALQLLQLVRTDATLANLLTFGVEGTDYQVKDGIACDLVNNIFYAYRRGIYGTYAACVPCESDYEKSHDFATRSREYENTFMFSPYLGKQFDTTGYEKFVVDILNLESILVIQAMNTSIDEYEEVLQQTLQQYKNAGIDELVAAVNEQLGIQAE